MDERWSISGDAKVAVGANFETLSVSGSTTSTVTSMVTPTSTLMLAGIPLTVATGKPPGSAAHHDEHNDKRQRDFRVASEFR